MGMRMYSWVFIAPLLILMLFSSLDGVFSKELILDFDRQYFESNDVVFHDEMNTGYALIDGKKVSLEQGERFFPGTYKNLPDGKSEVVLDAPFSLLFVDEDDQIYKDMVKEIKKDMKYFSDASKKK